jgi:hypothetical protein
MPRRKISPTETKREKFLRLATLRTKEVLSRLRILGNCANRQMYEYNESDIDKIFSVIDKQLKDVKGKFTIIKEKDFKL